MRVIAGTARSLKLVTPEGTDTRPTTDRIKETLFNMLQFDLQDASFLDLFAGSGAIGIEALSRGASYACFVDSSTKAEECIKSNLTHTKFIDKASKYKQDDFVIIPQLGGHCAEMRIPGIWTFCLHPTAMNDSQFKAVEQFLEKHKDVFISISDLELNKLHKKSIISKLLSFTYFVIRKLKGLK